MRPNSRIFDALDRIARSVRGLATRAHKRACRRVARSLPSGYAFTRDHVSKRAYEFSLHLERFRGKPDIRLLEVGSFEGRSAIWFLENILTHPTARMTCVDIFPMKSEIYFDHNIRVSGQSGKITKLKGRSDARLLDLADTAFDIAYIDGSHRAANALMDGVLVWRLLRDGGVIIFDDYKWRPDRLPGDRPQLAIDLFLELHAEHLEILHREYQVVVRRVRGGARELAETPRIEERP